MKPKRQHDDARSQSSCFFSGMCLGSVLFTAMIIVSTLPTLSSTSRPPPPRPPPPPPPPRPPPPPLFIEQCPPNVSYLQSDCFHHADLLCEYGEVCCESTNTCHNTTFASCSNQTWIVASVFIYCPEYPSPPPPSTPS